MITEENINYALTFCTEAVLDFLKQKKHIDLNLTNADHAKILLIVNEVFFNSLDIK